MFELLKMNQQIERALQIAKNELGMSPLNAIGGRTSAAAQEWRAGLRGLIKSMGLNDHELAVAICAPFASSLQRSGQGGAAAAKVAIWQDSALLREEVAEFFLGELRNGATVPDGG